MFKELDELRIMVANMTGLVKISSDWCKDNDAIDVHIVLNEAIEYSGKINLFLDDLEYSKSES